MSEEPPLGPEPGLPEGQPAPLPAPEPERYPFWGYFDVLVVAGIAFAGFLASSVLMAVIASTLHIPPGRPDVRVALPGQVLLYIALFCGLAAWLRLQASRNCIG